VMAFACHRTHTAAPPLVAAGAAYARPGAHSSRRCLRPSSHSVTFVSAAACGGLSFEAVVSLSRTSTRKCTHDLACDGGSSVI
jgi:hypothetical protein